MLELHMPETLPAGMTPAEAPKGPPKFDLGHTFEVPLETSFK